MKQTQNAIVDEIRGFISREFILGLSNNGLEDDTNFIEAGIVDSYGVIEIITFVEAQYGVKMTDEDLVSPDLTSISGLGRLIAKRLK